MIADDMIIARKDETEHYETLRKVMERAKDKNIKFNKDKVQLKVREVQYLGNIISADGMKPDPEKIKAVQKMSVPTDKAGLGNNKFSCARHTENVRDNGSSTYVADGKRPFCMAARR
jgi:hypothetical protein